MPDQSASPIHDPETAGEAEFNARLATDDAFVAHVREEMEKALAIPPTPETADKYPAIRASLASFKSHVAGIRVQHRLILLRTLLNDILTQRKFEDLPAAHALIEEITDLALDVKEPLRTQSIQTLTALREAVRAIEEAVGKLEEGK